jgi:hypothetical protein
MTKRDRLLELATELVTARARVTELEAQIDELFGEGDGATRPGRRSTKRKEAGSGDIAAGGAALPPVTNGHGGGPGRKPSEESLRIIALAKGGMAATQIAAELGWKGRTGVVKATNVIYRARKAGHLPKAGASR